MEISIKKFEELSNKELYEILKLRSDIFIVEQNCAYPDIDGKDYPCLHLMIKENEELMSYVRILPKGTTFDTASIGRVVTSERHRRKGLSRLAMQTAIELIKNQWKEPEITISAQYYLREFYASLGFVIVGEIYIEDGLEHIKMILNFNN